MALRQLELLISQSRRATENEEFSDSAGLSTEEFIQYANDAQDDLQAGISAVSPEIFMIQTSITAISGQEAYSIPSDAFLGTRIDLLEYSPSGDDNDYYQVKQGRLPERLTGVETTPSFYIIRGTSFLAQPRPGDTTGLFRLTYQRRLPRLEIRQGQVLTATLATDSITSLVLDTTQGIGDTELEEENFLTVVDKNGTVKMQDIEFTDVDASTGVVTIAAGFTFDSGETIAVGDYVVRGGFSTSHSQLPPNCERYIVSYINWKILKRDSSNDSQEQGVELQVLKKSIIDSFAEPDNDVDYITVLDDQFLIPEDDL